MSEDSLDELEWASDGRRVSFTLDEELYPRDAIFGASYLFVDRCWIFLTRPSDRHVEVRLKPKEEDSQLESLAGEFCNELLNQVVRLKVGESTRTLREYTMARAFFQNTVHASIDALLAELDAEELEQDDLEISVPWETGGE